MNMWQAIALVFVGISCFANAVSILILNARFKERRQTEKEMIVKIMEEFGYY